MAKYVKKYGSLKLHKKLVKIDPDSAKRIHPNDVRRIIRALELYNSTGKTMTELKLETNGLGDRFRIKMFGLNMPREKIYKNDKPEDRAYARNWFGSRSEKTG